MRYKLLAVAVVLIAAGLALAPLGTADRQANRNFTTHLDGQDNDVDTPAQGEAIFHISRDGDSISYRLIVANIENVAQAHIHLAPAGSNGPVVVWLYPDGPPPELIEGRFSGVLATGTFTEADLVGPLEGSTLEDLIEEMRAGNTYVNVHTSQNPAGEIRGQL